MARNLITTLFCLLAWALMAAPGDDLIVLGNIVNMRKGPAIDYPVTLKLKKGRKLVEIQRDNGWVEVKIGRDDIKSGWIYSSLLGKDMIDESSIALENTDTDNQLFELFKLALNELNEKSKASLGEVPFTKTKYMGNYNIQITATDAWLSLPRTDREKSLSDVFEIWSAAVGDDLSIMVYIIDKNGDRLMTMLR